MLYFLRVLVLALLSVTMVTGQADARFIQADWFEVTEPGVGTNRYTYCNNDPINCMDPGGNDHFDAAPNAGELYEEEDQAFQDFINDGTVPLDERIDALIDQYNHAMGMIAQSSIFNEQAIGFGQLAATIENFRNIAAANNVRAGLGELAGAPVSARPGMISQGTPNSTSPQRPSSDLPAGIGIGPYAPTTGGVPASRVNARPTAAEGRAVDAMGQRYGCHNCGSPTSGTTTGRYVRDHQPPTSLNVRGGPQQYYPHCTHCSAVQGGRLRHFNPQ